MAAAVASGMPKLRIEEAAARKQARIDTVNEVVVGVNKYQDSVDDNTGAGEAPSAGSQGLELLSVDNEAVLAAQLARLKGVRANRDEGHAQARLRFLTEAAWRYEEYEGHIIPSRSDPEENLLSLSIAAARARCTVGEISSALEAAWYDKTPCYDGSMHVILISSLVAAGVATSQQFPP
eukprot:SAG31_NODE_799_length_12017_cov_5.478436_7_plen_179_part_00